MKKKNYFEKQQIKTIETFFNFMKSEFQYGWIDQLGKSHNGINDAKSYCLQTPNELLQSRIGNCWDRTELYRYFFQTMTNLNYETYYLFYEDNQGCPSHSILVFYQNNHVYWFEPMFQEKDCDYCGIHEYHTILELWNSLEKAFLKSSILNKVIPKHYDPNNLYLYRYEQPNYHINGFQMREHINQSTKIKSLSNR